MNEGGDYIYKAAIIGAGRVGTSLGLYFFDNDYLKLEGFYSKTLNSSKYSSKLTNTKAFENIRDIADNCDVIFITTPDDEIKNVWEILKKYDLKDKIICHCSGSLSSDIFSKSDKNFYSCSMHPMLAFSSKDNSYKDLNGAFFTLEGDNEALDIIKKNLDIHRNPYKILDSKDKSGYHLSTVCISNLVIGLGYMAEEILKTYGFTEEEAREALKVLGKKNLDSFFSKGAIKSLTGPVERGDFNTINSHLNFLKNHNLELEEEVYSKISTLLIEISKKKNPTRDYDILERKLKKD